MMVYLYALPGGAEVKNRVEETLSTYGTGRERQWATLIIQWLL